VKADGDVE
jgi:hypothetical protein